MLPYLENGIGFRHVTPAGGVAEDQDIPLQSINIYAPDDPDGERVIKVIGNAYVEKSVKTLQSLILSLLLITSSTCFTVWATPMILTTLETAACVL